MEQKVTPWEVSGKINYEKLIKQFGLRHLHDLPKIFTKNVLFRRNLVFAHRDFGRIVDAVENKKDFVMMTGLMPSGKFHFGHKMVADQIIFYQNLGAKIYLNVADVELLTNSWIMGFSIVVISLEVPSPQLHS